MDGSIGFSTTHSIRNYSETSFTLQNKLYKKFGTSHKFKKKWNFMNLKKKLNEMDGTSHAMEHRMKKTN